MQKTDSVRHKGRPLRKLVKTAGFVLGAGFIFMLGVSAGNGRLQLGQSVPFRGSIQRDLPADLDYTTVEELYDQLRATYDGELSEQELLDGLKEGLANASGDQYTEYMDQQTAEEFNQELSGTFTGIGAELSKNEDAVEVVAPLSGFPAEKAGLRPKDIIVEVDGKSTYDQSLTEVVKRIRGPKGTSVKLTVIRNNSEEIELTIVRDNINVPSVKYEIVEGNIGYLQISRFGDDTTQLVYDAAGKFKQAKVKGIVLDLRSNPGGYLESSVDVASLWLDNKTVLTERRGDVVIKEFQSRGTPILKGIPTVVLINEGSASASEIVAGALKDHDAATLLGQKTYGKGSVQQPVELRGGGILKVTVARWYTPKGRNIDQEGIEPDTKVEVTDEDYEAKRDPQKDAALEQLRK